jgi:hypothetical protein
VINWLQVSSQSPLESQLSGDANGKTEESKNHSGPLLAFLAMNLGTPKAANAEPDKSQDRLEPSKKNACL